MCLKSKQNRDKICTERGAWSFGVTESFLQCFTIRDYLIIENVISYLFLELRPCQSFKDSCAALTSFISSNVSLYQRSLATSLANVSENRRKRIFCIIEMILWPF